MDNDAAHHANIALHMYLTGDYVSLIDTNGPYLDKPHFFFWLCAISYKLFGVTTFAYKFPSLLFSAGAVYSVYRLGKTLYNNETGRSAALVMASSFGFLLSASDVRMEAVLTACVVFSTWQLVAFVQTKKLTFVPGAALGLALGFSTKGQIGVLIPVIAILFYILYKKDFKIIQNPKWLLLIFVFAILTAPVLYCFYQQFGMKGVRFILLNQNTERFMGQVSARSSHNYFFFLHSFLWVFAPWSLIAIPALFLRLKNVVRRKEEWLSVGTFIVLLILFSLSGYKLPHYLDAILPFSSLFCASFIAEKRMNKQWEKIFFVLQSIVVAGSLAVLAFANAWVFPLSNFLRIIIAVFLLALLFYFFKSEYYSRLQRSVAVSVAVMVLAFFLLNTNFYPQLLQYQGGNELAFAARKKTDVSNVYAWQDMQSSSFFFYIASIRKQFNDNALTGGKPCWLLFDARDENQIVAKGYKLGQRFEAWDYEITRLNLKFLNPATRKAQCGKMILAEITK